MIIDPLKEIFAQSEKYTIKLKDMVTIKTQQELDELCFRTIQMNEIYEIMDPTLFLKSNLHVYGKCIIAVDTRDFFVCTHWVAQVFSYGFSHVKAYDRSKVHSCGYNDDRGINKVECFDLSRVETEGKTEVIAHDYSWVRFSGDTKITLLDQSIKSEL